MIPDTCCWLEPPSSCWTLFQEFSKCKTSSDFSLTQVTALIRWDRFNTVSIIQSILHLSDMTPLANILRLSLTANSSWASAKIQTTSRQHHVFNHDFILQCCACISVDLSIRAIKSHWKVNAFKKRNRHSCQSYNDHKLRWSTFITFERGAWPSHGSTLNISLTVRVKLWGFNNTESRRNSATNFFCPCWI